MLYLLKHLLLFSFGFLFFFLKSSIQSCISLPWATLTDYSTAPPKGTKSILEVATHPVVDPQHQLLFWADVSQLRRALDTQGKGRIIFSPSWGVICTTSDTALSWVAALDLPWEMVCRLKGCIREVLQAKAGGICLACTMSNYIVLWNTVCIYQFQRSSSYYSQPYQQGYKSSSLSQQEACRHALSMTELR